MANVWETTQNTTHMVYLGRALPDVMHAQHQSKLQRGPWTTSTSLFYAICYEHQPWRKKDKAIHNASIVSLRKQK